MDFLKEVIRNPKSTGAIAASSKQLVQMIVDNADLGTARCVVELGPGTGAFTGEILQRIPEDASYIAIELNPKFVSMLQEKYPYAAVHEGSAADIGDFLEAADHDSCDRVISGIPWTVLSPKECEILIERVADAIEPNGLFLTLAYFPMNQLPRGRALKALLQRHFASVELTDVVPANLPPAFVYVCRK